MVLLSAGSGHSQGQSSASFQYVATAGGELRALSTPYAAHPGSRQFVYFSNDKLTIAATIEVEDTRGGVALVTVRTESYPGTVDRETSEKELKSALQREYTYVPTEELSPAVDGGGALSLVGAIADESGNLSKPIAPLPVGPEAGQIMLTSPALLCGDRVMANLKVVAGTEGKHFGVAIELLLIKSGGLLERGGGIGWRSTVLLEVSEALTEGQLAGQLNKAQEIAALTTTVAVEEIFAGVDIE
jgi:hypothetical protein